ncbi:MAG TPA: O-antigen ligase family protein, partial [Polyangia bacterium]|nr:O-antigen ligase family protein [Polyangia bacterium]
MLIGAVHPATQVILSAAALALFAAYGWMRRARGMRTVPFAGAMLLALVFTAIQLVPLPAPLVALLSPEAYQLRRQVGPDRWFVPLTVDVPATLLALARGAACAGVFLVLGRFVRSRRHARRLAWAIAATGALVALIAFVQRAAGVDAIYGFYRPRSLPGFGVFGSFVDVNHAASVLALGLLVSAGVAIDVRGTARVAAIACAALCGCALLFSASRGALVGAAIGSLLFAVVQFSRVIGWVRGSVAALVVLVAVMAFSLWTSEAVRARFTVPAQQLWSNQKTRGWSAGLRMADAYRWTGVGRGAFETPVDAFRVQSDGVRLVYPEDIFVQLASEWGFPAAIAIMMLVLASARRFVPAMAKLSPTSVAAVCGVIAVVAHEVTDFGLETLGVALPTTIALGIAVGESGAEDRKHARHSARSRIIPAASVASFAAAWVLTLALSAWAARRTVDADWSRLTSGRVDDGNLAAAIARHPADDYLELLAAQRALQAGSATAMHHINRALTLNPSNWQAHRMAARLLAATHHTSQAALEYRLAIDNGFAANFEELATILGPAVVDAVPQQPPALFDLAR